MNETNQSAATCCGAVDVPEKPANTRVFAPRVDIVETEGGLLLYADLPGVRPEDIDLHYERGELTLSGKAQLRPAAGRVLFAEYDVGDFHRVFQLHESIDATRIEAEFKNGVLKVHLPKQEIAKPKAVPVRVQ